MPYIAVISPDFTSGASKIYFWQQELAKHAHASVSMAPVFSGNENPFYYFYLLNWDLFFYGAVEPGQVDEEEGSEE